MKTKEDILKYCRDLLYSSPTNYPIQKGDFEFLVQKIFPLHERFMEKCNGKTIKAIIVHNHKEYNNRCFALVLSDNSVVDISFVECVYRKGLRENIERACFNVVRDDSKRAKEIVREWIKGLELGELTAGACLEDYNKDSVYFTSLAAQNSFVEFYNGRK